MQGIWQKIKYSIMRFMVGRHGVDSLNMALLYGGIAVNIVALITRLNILSSLSTVMLFFAIFRMLSKNRTQRYRENAWYLKHLNIKGFLQKAKQAYIRFKNRKTYLYFDCPQCHAKLRLPRGKGEVTVTCGKCANVLRKET